MFGELHHRTHHYADLIRSTIQSAFFTAGAVLMLVALLVLYLGLLAMKP